MSRKHTERKKSREGTENNTISTIKSSFIGAFGAMLIMIILWFIATAIAYSKDDPDSIVGILGFSVVYVTALCAGVISAKINGRSALACGVVSGVIFIVLLLGISLFFDDSFSSEYTFALQIVFRGAIIGLSILGGFLGVHKKSTHRRKRR